MKYIEEHGDLFDLNLNCYYAHCISADLAMGAGIAVEFQKRFNLRNKIKKIGDIECPQVVLVDNVFNLITKEKYYNKPTLNSLRHCIIKMKDICIEHNVSVLAMPKIGCGLDKLSWDDVRDILKEEFKDIDMTIIIRFK